MASLKEIKKRIGSVKSTQKITKAMKMVAAAKLRRAQHAAHNARHYTDAIWGLGSRIAASMEENSHPLTRSVEKAEKRDYLILTSDRGLCGGFNSNLLRRLGEALAECRKAKIITTCRVIGKKGKDYFAAKEWNLAESVSNVYEQFNRNVAEDLAGTAIRRFERGKAEEVYLVYNYFRSTMVQEATFEKVLPLQADKTNEKPADFIFEPSKTKVLDRLLRESVVSKIYGAFLESIASELAARMAAMENATRNASDMIDYLSLQYNRARQAAITTELMDIVNGAEALA